MPASTGMVETDVRTQPGLLELLAWFSPAMPTGAFSYSHGLEWAVEAALVHDTPACAAMSKRSCGRDLAAWTPYFSARPTAPASPVSSRGARSRR